MNISVSGVISETARLASCSGNRSEEHTSELQSQSNLVCRLLLEKKKELDDAAVVDRAGPLRIYLLIDVQSAPLAVPARPLLMCLSVWGHALYHAFVPRHDYPTPG